VLSPNLAEPWITQLRPPNYRAVVYAPPVPVHPNEPPIGMWRGQADRPAPSRLVPLNPHSDGSEPQRMASVDPDASTGQRLAPEFMPTEIDYNGPQKAGTIIIDTNERHLYLVEPNGKARRYGVGVGRPGFEWAGEHTITRKAEWPDWTPPDAMLKRQPKLPHHMDGGPNNPLGARALYLGSTEYRIHGTSEPWTIGHAVSSGCIRMRNQDVEDLYERVRVGTKVIVM
jgi:lipoprotein-anchoring transpeptidase ErfK/SrfK